MKSLSVTALRGPDRGCTFQYEGYCAVVLGRDGTPDVAGRRPQDPYLSRAHLRFEAASDAWSVKATASGCAFFLNGRRTVCAPVTHGDLIQAGRTLYRVELRADGPADAALLGPARNRLTRRCLDEFEVGPRLGRGSLSIVHEARDRRSGERIALKFLSGAAGTPPQSLDYFLREMDIVAELQHPHLARPLCIGVDGAIPFLGMELIRGETLHALVEEHGCLDEQDTLRIGGQVLRALAYAHRLGFVHRDVKPSNVMICGDPGVRRAYLVDFGLARSFGERRHPTLTGTGELRGSLGFGAPECLRDARRVGPQADVFGLGATLYFALSGGYWFDAGGGVRSAYLGLTQPVARVPLRSRSPGVRGDVAALIDRALELDPAERWRSARAMGAALAACEEPGPV